MSSYVVTFRSPKGRVPSAEEEAAWMSWLGTIGSSIRDFGHRVGSARLLGVRADDADVLSGYVVIDAVSLDAAADLVAGCPGLGHGGSVEIGETAAA